MTAKGEKEKGDNAFGYILFKLSMLKGDIFILFYLLKKKLKALETRKF